MTKTRVWRSAVWLMAGGALLACLLAGCNKKDDSQKAKKDPQVTKWRSKYEALVEQNEKVYKEIEDLKKRNEALEERMAELREKASELAAKKPVSVVAQKHAEEIAALKEQLADKDRGVEKLLTHVAMLKDELAAAAGEGEADARLANRIKVRAQLEVMGKAMIDQHRYEMALRLLSGAVDLGAAEPVVLFQMGYCHGELGDDGAAAEWYARAVLKAEKQPEDYAGLLPKLYSNYGATLVRSGKPQEGLKWYEKSVKANDKYPAVHFNLGRLYAEHLKSPEKAIAAYRRHVALGGRRSISARKAIVKLQGMGAAGKPAGK